ncbi:hypothetical protein MMC07_001070 [Pseudocyphellaria aurata]|nr:hypothetical protein [Pseudocyphellaria aurata]
MSLGLSLGDLKSAVDLGFLIYERCFTRAERADVKYLRFGRDIQSLTNSLQQLIDVTKHARDERTRRPWGSDFKDDDCRGDLEALAEVTGDFFGTLQECQTLLDNRAKFGRNEANFVTNVLWHTSTEREVNSLRERVHLHVSKLFFTIKPFETQLLIGIRSQLIRLQEDVEVVKGLVVTLYKNDILERGTMQIHPTIQMLQIPKDIVDRFLDALKITKPDSFHDITAFPLKEGFDALVFHFAKSTVEFNPGVGPSQRIPEETQYINLLKSKWILEKLKMSSLLFDAEPDSLWKNYLEEVEIKILEEYRRFETRRLIAPPFDDINRLPDSCFSIWVVEAPPLRPPDLAEERPLEDKILELTLPSPGTKTLTIFRNNDVEFRLVIAETFAAGGHKVVERESIPINMQSTRLIPAYTIRKSTPAGSKSVNNVLLYRIQDHASMWQYLQDLDDVKSFQQALSGYRVFYDTFKCDTFNYDTSKVNWSLNGSNNAGKCGDGRVQFWQVKRLPKLVQNDGSEVGQYPLSPLPSPQFASEKDLLRRPSTGVSSMISHCSAASSMTSQITGSRGNGTAIFPPEPPVLIIYTMCEEKHTFLHLELSTEVFVNQQSCYCKKSPTKCKRVVLEARKMIIRKHSAQEKGDEMGLLSWDLARFRLPRHPKYRDVEVLPKITYICFDFATVAAKDEFLKELQILFTHVRDYELELYRNEISRRQQMSNSPGRR